MNSPFKRLIQQMPHIVVIIWLMLIGFLVWQHVAETEQPPLYDAYSYFLKAKLFWAEVDRGHFFNPLNLEPSIRPPGTILMSYPLGFSGDFRPFYFRSVFLPLLFLVVAVYIVAYSPAMLGYERWNLALLSIFLSTLPIFYQFEWQTTSQSWYYWGLVDNFLAGVAALSTAAIIRGITRRSFKWLFVGVFLSGFCILIKPAGILVMGLLGLGGLILILFAMKTERTKAIQVISLAALIYLFFLTISFSSKYLSAENIAFGKASVVIMKNDLTLNLSSLKSMLNTSLGYPFFFGIAVIGLCAIIYWKKPELTSSTWTRPLLRLMIAAAFLNLAVGIWFWIEGSGGKTQIRYFYPFIFMFIIWLCPLIMRVIAIMKGKVKTSFCILCILPAINIALLLAIPNPSTAWLRYTGVNIVGDSKIAIKQAGGFLNEITENGDDARVYSASEGTLDAMLEGICDYRNVLYPSSPTCSISRPQDWQRPTVYRLSDILESDYILFNPIFDRQQREQLLSKKAIPTYEQETLLFRAWLTENAEKDGLSLMSESSFGRLMKITDIDKFEASLHKLREEYFWRKVFLEANPSSEVRLKRWWSQQEIAALHKSYPINIVNIDFGGVFKLKALSVRQSNNEIYLRVWWERMKDTPGRQWGFFIHSIDKNGNIIANAEIPISRNTLVSNDSSIRLSNIVIPQIMNMDLNALAVGFHSGSNILQADRGTRDWDNRRVIIPLMGINQ